MIRPRHPSDRLLTLRKASPTLLLLDPVAAGNLPAFGGEDERRVFAGVVGDSLAGSGRSVALRERLAWCGGDVEVPAHAVTFWELED